MKNIFIVFFILLLCCFANSFSQPFLKTSGTKIVDESENEVILRSIGIGGWWLQEGYMFETSAFANTQHELRKKIEDLIGTDSTEIFYETFLNNFVTRRDIDSIALWGFNSIRLPMHYNLLISATEPDTFIDKGFKMIDSLILWCRPHNMYIILDLHAAPGGQGHDQPISDYDPSKPSLWESEENQALTAILWKEIARRYAHEPIIGGYDILNEPNWELGSSNQVLRSFYQRITDSIRKVDTSHIIFIEGNWFATDFNGLTPPWDNNMVYSFHKYWSAYNTSSIQYLLNIRDSYNVPLWLGETGENSNHWFTQIVNLMNQHKIGWACWPYKKTGSVAGPLTIPKPAGYQVLLNYWNGQAPKPTAGYAFNALMELTDSLRIEHCTFHPDVIHAWMTFPGQTQTIPFRYITVPGKIFCADYDMGYQNTSYYDTDYQNTAGAGNASWNSGGAYRNDGVDIERCTDNITNGYNVGWINNGEWLTYTIQVTQSNYYAFNIRYASQSATGKMHIEIDGNNVTGTIDLPPTGDWQNWRSKVTGATMIESGMHKMKIVMESDGFNLNYIDITVTSGLKISESDQNSLFEIHYDHTGKNPLIKANFMDNNPFSIELFDHSGKMILSDYFNDTYRISDTVQQGLYFVTVRNNTYYSTQKIRIN